ncbi:MAG TPA: type I phosphomannose isomerase catalytic subunit [Anaerolineaceae bacterium]
MTELKPFHLIPEYRDYVWGGDKLRPGIVPTAEAWVVYEGDRIGSGSLQGRTLAEASAELGESLLGSRVIAQRGRRFPLLIKLLDCAQWLSLQVHPNDEQAVQLEGTGSYGKTEAWHFLETAPGAQIVAGLKPGTDPALVAPAVRGGTIQSLVRYIPVQAGDTVLMRAGTVHALGPGMLVYEVQESSDYTYRVYDWGRPQTSNRVLHIEKSLAVINPALTPRTEPAPALGDGETALLTHCEYFDLELISVECCPVEQATGCESFHALTVIEGAAQVEFGGERLALRRFETALVPAACSVYRVLPEVKTRLLKARVS